MKGSAAGWLVCSVAHWWVGALVGLVGVGCEGPGSSKGPGAPHDVPPGMPPEARWVRNLGAVEVGPLPWYGADGTLLGAVYASEDSLVALRAEDGRPLAAWPWPEGFKVLNWGQESTASSAYGLALFGVRSVQVLRPDGRVEVRDYPAGGASFRSGSMDASGGILISWRRDSSAAGPESNEVLVSSPESWNLGAGLPAKGWSVEASAPGRSGLFDAPRHWKRGWFAVLRRGSACELWWTDRGRSRQLRLVGGDGTGHPAAQRGTDLWYASQDSAVHVDLQRGTRTWATAFPAGLDVGVHGLRPDGTWSILSSRGWWLDLNPSDGTTQGQGQLDPLWLERLHGIPWTLTRHKCLYMWDIDKPTELVLMPEALASSSVSAQGIALVRMGPRAVGIQLP